MPRISMPTMAAITALALASTWLAPGQALANDAYVTLGAGGLVLSKSEDIAMVREDLDVAVDRISVRYVFRNRSARDVQATVAFPLPPVSDGLLQNSPVDLAEKGTANFVGFTVKVDGKDVPTRLQEKAVMKGRDVTAEVRRFGLSPNVVVPGWASAPGADIKGAVKAGLVDDEESEIASWSFEGTFHWDQVFPAGRDIVVEHAYRPVAGSGTGDRKQYCVDAGTETAIQRMWKNDKDGGEHFASRQVDYVLISAKTWAGPIGEFHLTIRKDRPDTIVSTCMDGLRKTGPTTFEKDVRDYVPERDLGVLFVHARGNDRAPK